jgi:transposase, IS5 family
MRAVSSSGGVIRTMQQTTFASVAWEKKGKVTRRERFLAEMDAVIPWDRLLALIEPHYPKAGNGTQPKPMQQMLRIYFMQTWFNLSDPQAEDALYDIESMRRFAGIELLGHDIPDESTILRFRHLLEQHQLTEKIFAEIRTLLEEKRLLTRAATNVGRPTVLRDAAARATCEPSRRLNAPTVVNSSGSCCLSNLPLFRPLALDDEVGHVQFA